MSERFAPQVLREYSLIADGERGGVVGPRGEITWLCAPRWDSGSVFGQLIGGRGVYAVSPQGRFVWGGYYEARSLIWRSRWVTDDGIIECREALARPADPHRLVLLRRVQPVKGDAGMEIELHPAADYGRVGVSGARCTDGVWTGRVGGLHLRWSGAAAATPGADGSWRGQLTVPEGGHRDLVLELADRPLPDRLPRPDELWAATESAWRDETPDLDDCLDSPGAQQAYVVMRGLTSRGGGMVAAATTSLPERAEAGRSYDYRYVWIRNQCFAGQAVAAAGAYPLLDDATRFVAERILSDGPELAPAYTTAAGRVPDESHLDLSGYGYPGGSDVVGNHVNAQFQLDAFGEALALFAAADRRGRLDADGWKAADIAATGIAERWTEADAGVWELEPRLWTHSRLVAAAGLRAVARRRPSSAESARWESLADHLVTVTSGRGLRPDGAWKRSPEDPGLDGSLLLPALRGGVPPSDPRSIATLDAYLDELTRDGYAYRFRVGDQPLGSAEGSFLLCGFLTAMALHQQGRVVEAARWFERTQASAGPPQLFSEEYDATQHQMRGNLPQAFVHAFHLEASVRLADRSGWEGIDR